MAFFNLDKEAGRCGTPISAWIDAVHPDDLDYVTAQLMGSVETGNEYNARFRVVGRDGTIRHVQAHGRCLFDSNGRPSRFPGSIREVQGSAALSENEIEVILKRGQKTH